MASLPGSTSRTTALVEAPPAVLVIARHATQIGRRPLPCPTLPDRRGDSIRAMANEAIRDGAAGAYGANAWLVEEMYEAYLADPTSVSESWREFFADYRSPSRSSAVPSAA